MNITKKVVSTLCDLISIPTVNPPGKSYGQMAEYLAKKLRELSFDVELIEIPPGKLKILAGGDRRIIVYAKVGKGKKTLHFNGHYDVVPPGEGWSTDPFVPVVREGRIYGRGATDMKGGIAAILTALEVALKEGVPDSLTLEVSFVPDEETGGLGTRYLVEDTHVRPSFVVIGEPTTTGRIGIGHKGVIRGKVIVRGKQGHAARPWQGVSAFEKACMLVAHFLPRYRENLRKISTSYPVPTEHAKYPSISLGGYVLSSTAKANVIPGEFTFSFDRRVLPEEDVEDVSKQLLEGFEESAKAVGACAEVKIERCVEASVTPLSSSIVNVTKGAIKDVVGSEPDIMLSPGRYDLVFFRRVGIEGVAFGPGVDGQAHATDEYTTVEELNKAVRVYALLIKRMASK